MAGKLPEFLNWQLCAIKSYQGIYLRVYCTNHEMTSRFNYDDVENIFCIVQLEKRADSPNS